MPGLTLDERYFAINEAINKFLSANSIDCPIFKYGIDPGTLKTNIAKNEKVYPYAMTSINNVETVSWTSEENGIYTRFEYQVNFFTSPKTEFTNDADLYKPFEWIKLALTDVNKSVLQVFDNVEPKITMLADLLSVRVIPGFKIVSGAILPSKILIAKMAAVCGYPDPVGSVGEATDISGSWDYEFII